MFWQIVIGGSVAAGIMAFMKGQNPLMWIGTSIPGAALLALMPPAKGNVLGERKRARRKVGDKLGLMTTGAVVGTLVVLGIVGVL